MNRELLIYVATSLYTTGYGTDAVTNDRRITKCFDIAELIVAEGKRRISADIRSQVKPRPPPPSTSTGYREG